MGSVAPTAGHLQACIPVCDSGLVCPVWATRPLRWNLTRFGRAARAALPAICVATPLPAICLAPPWPELSAVGLKVQRCSGAVTVRPLRVHPETCTCTRTIGRSVQTAIGKAGHLWWWGFGGAKSWRWLPAAIGGVGSLCSGSVQGACRQRDRSGRGKRQSMLPATTPVRNPSSSLHHLRTPAHWLGT